MSRFLSSNPLDVLDEDSIKKLRLLEECEDLDFIKAVKILGLDPKRDFRFANLEGIDLSKISWEEFDLTGAVFDKRVFFQDDELRKAKSVLYSLRNLSDEVHESLTEDTSVDLDGKSGVYLWGYPGRGKSSLVLDFLQNYGTKRTRIVGFRQFESEIQEKLHIARLQGSDDPIKEVAQQVVNDLDVLCIDDFEVRDISTAMILDKFFEAIWSSSLITLLTSSKSIDDQYRHGVNRKLFDLFLERAKKCLAIHHILDEIDYRSKKIQKIGSWLSSQNRNEIIDGIWRDLTSGNEEDFELTKGDTNSIIKRYWSGNVRVKFNDVCDSPLGPNEFQKLASSTRLLILEDVPSLASSMLNVANRFVALVDCLYDQECQILVTSEIELEELLSDAKIGSDIIARTLSRLKWMLRR